MIIRTDKGDGTKTTESLKRLFEIGFSAGDVEEMKNGRTLENDFAIYTWNN